MTYEDYFSALSASTGCFTEKGASHLLRRLRNEGIISFQTGLKAAHDCVLQSLAAGDGVPSKVPYLCRDAINSSTPPNTLLDTLSCFGKLCIDNVEPPAPWDAFRQRNEEVASFAGFSFRNTVFEHSVSAVTQWIEAYLGRFVPTLLRCKHGPGQTAEKLSGWDKWLAFDLSRKTRPCIRMVSVPKDVSGQRLIGIEYTERQWYQQGLAHALRETRFFRRYIQLTHLDRHLRLAMDDSYLTIDLKDASDRIPLSLAEILLPHRWYTALVHNTSTFASLPSGEDLRLSMFATMGCGFCFEVETLIFLACCVLASQPQTVADCDRIARKLSVFGDDIVVPADLFPAVDHMFAICGFVINKKKTCLTPYFKETVGFWIVNGVAMPRFTPRLSGSLDGPRFDDTASILALADRAAARGYWQLCESLLSECGISIRWDDKFHRLLVRASVTKRKVRKNSVCEDTRYRAFWLCGLAEQHDEPTQSVSVKREWLPLESYPSLFNISFGEYCTSNSTCICVVVMLNGSVVYHGYCAPS